MKPIEQKENNKLVKKRYPATAFAFSFLVPGLGQLYNGQFIKGIIFFTIPISGLFIAVFTRLVTYFNGMVIFFVILLIIQIYILIDAIFVARKKKNYKLKKYNKTKIYIAIIVVVFIIMIPIRYFSPSLLGIKAFKMASGSNNPTIQENDYVITDLKAYKNKPINYGDLIVFKRPNNEMYVYRVIGLPGDKIEVNDNEIKINGEILNTTLIDYAILDDFKMIEYEEELPNRRRHRIYRLNESYYKPKIYNEKITLPSNCYYVLGDNRDLALDSREIGYVLRDDIIGQVVYSYFSISFDRIGIDFRDR